MGVGGVEGGGVGVGKNMLVDITGMRGEGIILMVAEMSLKN